ncbi:hypothetical protein [Nocardioides sp. AX2bis]|uniref:hypothetical protein n=1 Tax=Nocardioides sp. AX2bis TaxID=2653157 RepID=UPI0013592E16|nr:hypothetical protein [Nocardioides sp. AX2bis]
MAVDVLVAFIAALAALIVACLSFADNSRTRNANGRLADAQQSQQRELAVLTADLEQRAKLEEHEKTAKAELDRAREPLVSAAVDLADRLDNMRRRHFLAYLSADDHRAVIASLSTLYRFARYWCVVESLYDRVVLLQFRDDEATRPVAALLREIGRTLASDKYGQSFMVWREEQRAVAELMRVNGAPGSWIGFATFVDRYEETFSRWLDPLQADLESTAVVKSQRLLMAQRQLAELSRQLDQEGTYREQWQRALDGARPPDELEGDPR